VDDADKLKAYIELWKQTVDVQKHFNDIEMRVRGLALTVLTFALGAAAVAIKDGTKADVLGGHIPLATIILFISAVLWGIFYFVDQIWYHRLLIGSVVHGQALEAEIAKLIPLPGGLKPGLTAQISESSPYQLPRVLGAKQIHSSTKIGVFYAGVAAILIVFGILSLTTDKMDASGSHPFPATPSMHSTQTR
jgi:hypothetical protein